MRKTNINYSGEKIVCMRAQPQNAADRSLCVSPAVQCLQRPFVIYCICSDSINCVNNPCIRLLRDTIFTGFIANAEETDEVHRQLILTFKYFQFYLDLAKRQ